MASERAPLTEHFSNRQFEANLDALMHGNGMAIPVRQRVRLCGQHHVLKLHWFA